jgi:DNA-binding transcriptional LysR family regulator
MTLHQLKVFVTVATSKSYTAASEKLRVRQPSVTLIIQSLQRELGVKLFDRLGHRVHLTRAGEELFHHAEEIVGKAEGIREELDKLQGRKTGNISVGGTAIAAASFLPVAVQKFKEMHRGVSVKLKVHNSRALENELLEGDLDVAILGRAPRSSLIVGKPYRTEEVVVIAPADSPLTKRTSVPLELIAKEPIIALKGTLLREMVEQRFAEMGFSFTPALEVESPFGGREAIRKAVASGLGISFTSKCHVVADVKAGILKVLKVPELNLQKTIYIAVHKNRRNAFLVKAFINFLGRYERLIH